jgi:hypothetical protein
MKNSYILRASLAVFFSAFVFSAHGQAFHKGSFVVNLSEGSTHADYSTTNTNYSRHHEGEGEGHIIGERDPICFEYGITNRWGIGLSSGADFFNVNPSSYYGFQTSSGTIKTGTTELTLDASYHFFVTPRLDLSLVGSFGGSSVSFRGSEKDVWYQYRATGNIFRLGLNGRYYFCKHLGVLAIASTYYNSCSTQGISGNTAGSGFTTTIKGRALEFGLCYRFGR